MNEDTHAMQRRCTLLAMALALVIGVSPTAVGAAQGNCQQQDAQVRQSKDVQVVDPPAGFPASPTGHYGICFQAPVTGTLNGVMTSCYFSEEAIGIGSDNVWANWAVTTYATRDGTLVTHEYDVVDYDQGTFTGLQKVAAGSTGRFADTTGTLIGGLELLHYFNQRGALADVRITGFVCKP